MRLSSPLSLWGQIEDQPSKSEVKEQKKVLSLLIIIAEGKT